MLGWSCVGCIKCVEFSVHVDVEKCTTKSRKTEGKGLLGRPKYEKRVILKWIFSEEFGVIWTEWSAPRQGPWPFTFHRTEGGVGISWLFEHQLTCHERLWPTELVSLVLYVCIYIYICMCFFFFHFSAVLLSWLWFFYPWRPSKDRKEEKTVDVTFFLDVFWTTHWAFFDKIQSDLNFF